MSTNIEYQNLIDYIKQLFGISANWGLIDKQISQFHNDLGYSYSGIKKCIEYWVNEKDHGVSEFHGHIGIVSSIYGEVYEWEKDKWKIKQLNEGKTFKMNNEVREININTPRELKVKSMKDIEIENFMNGEVV